MKYNTGEDFLNHLYKNMHMSDIVMHTAKKSDTPVKKINKYINRLEQAHDVAQTSKHKMDVLKQFYYDKYIIKEVPENYIALQKRIAREEGRGNLEITASKKEELLQVIQKDQKSSLDLWIDYLSSEDAMYPMWFKYYAFTEMLKLGKFDKEQETFRKRTSTTADSFIELNPEVLAQVYTILCNEIQSEKPNIHEEQALIVGESFKKLYTFYFLRTGITKNDSETDGKWIKYEQGDDYLPMWESLQGKNTGWCTAGKETAKTQLKGGDFYIYYTKDQNEEYKNPRIAIRMNGKKEIGEVRGVGKQQNLESNMEKIADKKLAEFPNAPKYRKKIDDMSKVTEIERKTEENIELTKEELIFIYELDSKIEGFGYMKDPRIFQIRMPRNEKKDYATIYDCSESQIATSLSDLKKGNCVVYMRDLKFSGSVVPSSFKSLRVITGNAHFNSLTSARGLENLQNIKYDANFNSLTSAEGLEKLQRIGSSANFQSLINAKGLESLQIIEGDAHFSSLTSAKGLENLQTIGGTAFFNPLTSAEGLENLQRIGCDARFESLTDAKGLENLQTIGKYAWFNSLTSAKGLESLQAIGGSAYFKLLTSAKGLENLQTIGNCAFFNLLTSAEGLEKLQHIDGYEAYFQSLIDAKGLENLLSIGEIIAFNSLLNANALKKCNKYEEIKKQVEMNNMLLNKDSSDKSNTRQI